MEISASLKLLRFFYEARLYLLIPLCILWVAYAIHLGRQRDKLLRLWLLALPMVILPLHLATTYCGYRYRMELRDRYAQVPGQPTGTYDISLMPNDISTEYARHDFHPRARDLKAQALCILLLLLLMPCLALPLANWPEKRQEIDTQADRPAGRPANE
ncbi:MAG: hypothetical protein II943_02570 [Victivallales bacterium]|nr:hypothetical protein [Victivallales bacterium]